MTSNRVTTDRDENVEGSGQSSGIPADGAADMGAREPLGTAGLEHWRESTITEPGLDDRGDVFFAAIEMTRMPMILSDPNLPDTPIVFANKAFLDLTGYEEDEILGRNCRFLQGARTDREAVAELRDAIAAKQSIAIELLNYRRDGTPFWNAVLISPVYDTAGNGYRVSSAISGEEAFRLSEQRHGTDPFDFLFTDLVVPGSMDGMSRSAWRARLKCGWLARRATPPTATFANNLI